MFPVIQIFLNVCVKLDQTGRGAQELLPYVATKPLKNRPKDLVLLGIYAQVGVS
jgi:hypothetical protein